MHLNTGLREDVALHRRQKLPACILAGGASSRFGSLKGLAKFNGSTLLELVHNRLREQTVGQLVLNACADGPYSNCNLPIIKDNIDGGIGPLAGLHAAMNWGLQADFDTVVTCPIDTPFIPDDLVKRLALEAAPAIVASSGRRHPIIGIWPCELATELESFIAQGGRSAYAWSERCNASTIWFAETQPDRDPFYNINTIADLENARP